MRQRTYEAIIDRYYATHEQRDLWFDQQCCDTVLRRWGHLLG
jgi:hypothetical protein